VSFDSGAYRQASLQGWEEAAAGWVRRQELMSTFAAPVSHWMVEAISTQPGQRVLELAAGLGESSMLAAELLAPMGGVIVSDQAEAMLDAARGLARRMGVPNAEFQVLNAEWIDLPLASVDAVMCRWGYMLMADPAAALAESRRVLRPGGRLALAVWAGIASNPWALLPAQELIARSLAPPADPDAAWSPGPFALRDGEKVRELLQNAGFSDVNVESIELVRRHPDFEELWESTLDLSRGFHDAVLSRPEQEIEELKHSLAERFAPHTEPDGSLAIPALTLVASAGA
jgi:SAM-dependent methyltransferase